MWVVVNTFTDVKDNGYLYKVGEEYPRLDYEPSVRRIKELLSNSNRLGVPLIAESNTVPPPATKKPRKKGGKASNDDGDLRVPPQLV